MTKKKRYVVAADTDKLNTEADLLRSLDKTENQLLERFPNINDTLWRFKAMTSDSEAEAGLAIDLLDRLTILRNALTDSDTPKWKAASIAMWYQDRLRDLWGPVAASGLGRIHRKGQPGRKPKPNDLAMSVLRHLKHGSSLSWKESLRIMEQRESINGIRLRRDGPASKPRWIFEKIGRNGKIVSRQNHAESTLEKKFFPKA